MIDYASRIYSAQGDVLYSKRAKLMPTFVEDTADDRGTSRAVYDVAVGLCVCSVERSNNGLFK